jgi:hypothetical protein
MDINVTTQLFDGKGVKRVKVSGPYESDHRFSGPQQVFRCEFFMEAYPSPEEQPLFYAELQMENVIELRNALSAILFSQGKQ